MALKVETHLIFPVDKIVLEYDKGIEKSSRNTSRIGATRAKMKFDRQFKGVAPEKHPGAHVKDSFGIMRSEYPKPGYRSRDWLFGVFASAGAGKWEDSVGGRAHFFEYGRGAPAGWSNVPQPPRSYMRVTAKVLARVYRGVTGQELTRVTKKVNRRVK